MNLNSPQEATTATPISHLLTANRIRVLIFGLLAPATAVTLPLTVHTIGRYDMPLAVTVGVAPAVPALLLCIVGAGYLMALLVSVLVTLGRIARGSPADSASARAVEDLFRWVFNPPIALLTLTPIPPASPDTAARDARAEVSPLPAAPGAASKESETVYYKLLKEMKFEAEAAEAAEAAAVAAMEAVAKAYVAAEAEAMAEVPAETTAAEAEVPVSRGRHARPAPEVQPTVAEDHEPLELDAAA